MPHPAIIADPVARFLVQHHIGDYCSVIGIPLTLWGLWITYKTAKSAKVEATNAKIAVSQLRETLGLVDTVAELTAATSLLEEIKRLHRAGSWTIVLDRYAGLRARLITINTSNSKLNDEQRAALQDAVVQLKTIEDAVEKAVARNVVPKNSQNYNRVIGEQMDKLLIVLTTVRQSIGD